MPASRALLEVQGGFTSLYCPACAAPVLTSDGPIEDFCVHVAFFIDWDGEIALASPEGLVGAEQQRQQVVVDLIESSDDWGIFLDRVTEAMSGSVLVMDLIEPETGGQEERRAVVAFDFMAIDE